LRQSARGIEQIGPFLAGRRAGTAVAFSIAVTRNAASDLVVDFLVPACLASRYRARLSSLSPLGAELRFAFCPSIFRSGTVDSCSAEISLVLGAVVVRLRGSFRVEREERGAIGRMRFVEPAEPEDLETLRRACRIGGVEQCVDPEEVEPEPEDAVGEVVGDSAEESESGSGFYPAFLQPVAV
jgi:hypothetical protein